MRIKKGPYGYFVCEEISDEDCIYYYAADLMEEPESDGYLPLSLSDNYKGPEISFDFTGLVTIDDYIKTNRSIAKISARRRSIGKLFSSFVLNMDRLIFPSLVCTDTRFIFTDSSGKDVKMCLLPLKDERITGLSDMEIEKMLEHPFFSEALTIDEKQLLIYAASNNDEELFLKECREIGEKQMKPKRDAVDFPSGLVTSFASACLSILSLASLPELSYGLAAAAIVFLVSYVKKNKKEQIVRIENEEERSQIYFDENSKNTTYKCAFLNAKVPIDGKLMRFSIYMDKTTIGSDRFLSDIYINDNSLSPVQAVIETDADGIYLTDCSENHNTFIENKKIVASERYEIKSGQKLTFGNYDFELTVV